MMKRYIVTLTLLQLTYFLGTTLAIPRSTGNSRNQNGYDNFEELDNRGRFNLSWTVKDGKEVEFLIEAETTGYVGLGVSPSGNMKGADIFIGGVKDGKVYGADYHGTGTIMPTIDTHQDWNVLWGKEEAGKTILRVSRLLNPCDDEDYPIGDDTTRLIWAISEGNSDELGYHHEQHRGAKSTEVVFPRPPNLDYNQLQNYSIMVNTTMPKQSTSYWCTIHRGPLLDSKRHVVAIETVLPPEPENWAYEHTHHFVIYQCQAPQGQDPHEVFGPYVHEGGKNHPGDFCHSGTLGMPTGHCYRAPLYIWAKGGKPMIFPDNVGFPIGEEGSDSIYYMIDIHFDNPKEHENRTFETGVAWHYTDQLRTHDAGIYAAGNGGAPSLIIPPNATDFIETAHCPSKCHEHLPAEGVNVFAILQHSHMSGRKMKTRQFRNGVELPWPINDEHYDFDFQQNRILLEPFKLMPGDALTVEATYDTTWNDGKAVIGGASSWEEMLQDIIYYYPRVYIGCVSQYPVAKSFAEFGVEVSETVTHSGPRFLIVKPEKYAGMDFEDYLNTEFEWTEDFKKQLAYDRRYGDQEVMCGSNNFTLHNPYPTNFREYVPLDMCATATDGSSVFGQSILYQVIPLVAMTYRFLLL